MINDILTTTDSVFWKSLLNNIEKSNNPFTPIQEAFLNSLEAIKLKYSSKTYQEDDSVEINLYYKHKLDTAEIIDYIEIKDSGIGFDTDNLTRFIQYSNDSKSFNNKGTGRYQLLHFFKFVDIYSYYKAEEFANFVSFRFSKEFYDTKFIGNIVENSTENIKTGTTIKIYPFEEDKTYDFLNTDTIYNEIVKENILEFNLHKNIPTIRIHKYLDGEEVKSNEKIITKQDIPTVDNQIPMTIYYGNIDNVNKKFQRNSYTEEFLLNVIVSKDDFLKKNEVNLTSKNTLIKEIPFEAFNPKDTIDGKRYLVLISSDMLDNPTINSNSRDNFRGLIDKKTLDKLLENDTQYAFDDKYILIDDIANETAKELKKKYPEIIKKQTEFQNMIDELKEKFLLDDSDFKNVHLSIGATKKEILTKVYKGQATINAELDNKLDDALIQLENLDTTTEEYEKALQKIINDYNASIPEKNKSQLNKYVVRRKLVLELFRKILDYKTNIQRLIKASKKADNNNNKLRDKSEHLLHNLIFKRGSVDTKNSDLWLIDDEYMYFSGVSEQKLEDLEIHGNKVFNEGIDEKYKELLGSRGQQRADILLFPEEGKCIILELKAPNKKIKEYVGQAEIYAMILANYVKPEFKLQNFYIYLFSNNINYLDIPQGMRFERMMNLNSYYSPTSEIKDLDGIHTIAWAYKEIVSYDDLYKRAFMRNKKFIDILENTSKESINKIKEEISKL